MRACPEKKKRGKSPYAQVNQCKSPDSIELKPVAQIIISSHYCAKLFCFPGQNDDIPSTRHFPLKLSSSPQLWGPCGSFPCRSTGNQHISVKSSPFRKYDGFNHLKQKKSTIQRVAPRRASCRHFWLGPLWAQCGTLANFPRKWIGGRCLN